MLTFAAFIAQDWPILIYILGMFLEILGVLFVANRFLNIRIRQIPTAILSSIIRGRRARAVAFVGEFSVDDPLRVLQGLGFIFLGFVLKMAGVLAKL